MDHRRHREVPRCKSHGTNKAAVLNAVLLDFAASARLRDQLLAELNDIGSDEQAAKWAHRRLAEKNKLNAEDARHIEAVFRTQLLGCAAHHADGTAYKELSTSPGRHLSEERH